MVYGDRCSKQRMFKQIYNMLFKTKKSVSKRNALARRDVYPEDIKGKEKNLLRQFYLDNLRFKQGKNLSVRVDEDTLEKILEDAKDLQRRTE